MQLTKLRAAPVLQAEVPPRAPAGAMVERARLIWRALAGPDVLDAHATLESRFWLDSYRPLTSC